MPGTGKGILACSVSSGGRIRTCDLRVMHPTTAFAAWWTSLWAGLSLHLSIHIGKVPAI